MRIIFSILSLLLIIESYSQYFTISEFSGAPNLWLEKNESFESFHILQRIGAKGKLTVPEDHFIILLVNGDSDKPIPLYSGSVYLEALHDECRSSDSSIFNFFKKLWGYLTSNEKDTQKNVLGAVYRSNDIQYIISDTLTLKNTKNIRIINPVTNSTVYKSKCIATCSVPVRKIFMEKYIILIMDEGLEESENSLKLAWHPDRDSIRTQIQQIMLLHSIENKAKVSYLVDYYIANELEFEANLLLKN